jgi:hypothetical protein
VWFYHPKHKDNEGVNPADFPQPAGHLRCFRRSKA